MSGFWFGVLLGAIAWFTIDVLFVLFMRELARRRQARARALYNPLYPMGRG